MTKEPVVCPFDKTSMIRRPASEMMALLVPDRNPAYKMLTGGLANTRGKWYECPKCGYVALFRKDGSEP